MTTILRTIPLFSGLSESELGEIARHAVTRSYPKNTIILSEGGSADCLYIIESGKVKVFLSDENGKEIVVNVQQAGEYFGELALIDDAARSASVMTLERTTVCAIPKQGFKEVLGRYPDIAVSLIKDLTGRIRLLTDNVKSLALLDVYGRVAKTLLSLATEDNGKLVIEDRLTQQDIANRVGASREMVARILKDLCAGGYISYDQRHIVINEHLPQNY